jgi:hypothetical protein
MLWLLKLLWLLWLLLVIMVTGLVALVLNILRGFCSLLLLPSSVRNENISVQISSVLKWYNLNQNAPSGSPAETFGWKDGRKDEWCKELITITDTDIFFSC